MHELANSRPGGAFWFASMDETLVEGAHVGVIASGGEGRQEQAGAPAAIAVLSQARLGWLGTYAQVLGWALGG